MRTFSPRGDKHKNPNHLRCRVSRRRICNAMCDTISQRSHHIKVTELCKKAKVSTPTFYSHYVNGEQARHSMENDIEQYLQHLLSDKSKPDAIFTILTTSIVRHQRYFLAVHHSNDHYILSRFMAHYRRNLVGSRLGDRSFQAYSGALQIIIGDWLEFEPLTAETAARTTKRLLKVPVRGIGY